VPPLRHQGVRHAQHQRYIGARADRVPDRLDFRRQIVAQRADQVEFRALPPGGAQPGKRDVLAGPAAADIVVLQRHAAKGEYEGAVRDQLVPADIIAGHGVLRADDMRQDHRRGARTVAVDRADIAARHVQEAVKLPRRVVEAPGARPTIRPAKDRARAMCRVDAAQFTGDEIERGRPRNGYKPVTPALSISPRPALEPAVADHRFGDPRPVRHRGGNIAEQRRWVGVARMRHDLDRSIAEQHREGAPMGAVRQGLGVVHRRLCQPVCSMS